MAYKIIVLKRSDEVGGRLAAYLGVPAGPHFEHGVYLRWANLSKTMAYKFIVVNRSDEVGVALAAIEATEIAQGFYLEDSSTILVAARADIPLGHKIALRGLAEGAPGKKYGQMIG